MVEAKVIRHQSDHWKRNALRSKASATAPGDDVDNCRFLVQQLNAHRATVLRRESRAAQIAYAYLRGKSYRSVEVKTNPLHPQPDWSKVEVLVKSFGAYGAATGLLKWYEASTLAEPPAVT